MQQLALIFALFIWCNSLWANPISTLGIVQSVENDDVRAVRKAVEKGTITVNQMVESSPYGENGISILGLAARAGALQVAEYLINNNADLNIQNSAGETAVMLAAFFDDAYWKGEGNFEKNDAIAKMLVDHGANLDNGNYWSALSYAAFKGRHAIGEYMIQHGAPVNGFVQEGVADYMTPLMMAVQNGNKQFVLILLRADADAHVKMKNGATAMSIAKHYRQTHVIKELQCALDLKSGEKYRDICE